MSRVLRRLVTTVGELLTLACTLAALIALLAVVFSAFSANPANPIVHAVTGWATDVVGPFHNVFTPRSARLAIAVNYLLAAVVYLVVGGVLRRVFRRG